MAEERILRNRNFFVGKPYNWSFYHPDPIEGEEGGILLLRYSISTSPITHLRVGLQENFVPAPWTPCRSEFPKPFRSRQRWWRHRHLAWWPRSWTCVRSTASLQSSSRSPYGQSPRSCWLERRRRPQLRCQKPDDLIEKSNF